LDKTPDFDEEACFRLFAAVLRRAARDARKPNPRISEPALDFLRWFAPEAARRIAHERAAGVGQGAEKIYVKEPSLQFDDPMT